MNTYFTSDSHLNHGRIIGYCHRPFDNVEEMNRTLITNWNKVITNNDIVYHLGDFSWGDPYPFLKQLNFKEIHLIQGNHDRITDYTRHIFTSVDKYTTINIKGQYIFLSHFAMRVWDKSHFGSWNLYGHSHGGLDVYGKSLDVGVDSNSFYPLSFDEVKEKMKTLPNNFNLVRR